MRETRPKDVGVHHCQSFRPLGRTSRHVLSALTLALLAVTFFTCACAPSSAVNGGSGQQAEAESGEVPELTDETINERINDAWVRGVPEENGAGEPISWGFDENEPKEVTVVDKQIEVPHATVVLDVRTRSAQNSRNPRYLVGQIRTEWQLRTGWVLRRWEIVHTENVSMKYRNLPKPSPSNARHEDLQ